MKAIIENKNTYKITSEKGDFFITEDNKGKVKMFAKKNVSVIEIAEIPKAKNIVIMKFQTKWLIHVLMNMQLK